MSMSEEYERMAELREPLLRMADAVESIAGQLERRDLAEPEDVRLGRIEAILLDLYPDTCRRHGLGLPASRELRGEVKAAGADRPIRKINPDTGNCMTCGMDAIGCRCAIAAAFQ